MTYAYLHDAALALQLQPSTISTDTTAQNSRFETRYGSIQSGYRPIHRLCSLAEVSCGI
jgi:hypothetical protein